MRKLFPLLLMTLFLASFLPAHALVLNAGYFLYVPIHVNSLSAIVYAVVSNATVTVALMTPSEFSQFNSTGSLQGIVVQNGSAIVNGVLANPGLYYLVIYSPTQSANISYFYNTTPITPENSSTYVEEFVTIPPDGNYSLPIHLTTLGSPSTLLLFGVSNQTVYYTVFNNESQVFFNSSPITLTWNYTSETCFYNVDLPTGVYFLYIINPHDTPAYLAFAYRVLPKYVNPYLYIEITHTNAYPMGIASYGVSGTKTYVVNTTSVLGYFNITSLLAYNGSQNLVPAYEASLQLNSVLVINNDDNSTWILWPQDVLVFLTNESIVLYHDNVFNMTNPTATLTNQSIKGDGYVEPSPQGGNYYGNYNSSPCFTYSLPFSGYLVMNESIVKGKGVLITFSVIVLENGSSTVLSSQTFDKVLVVDPNVSSAYFQVNGMEYTPAGPTGPLGVYYDTELVFGGGGNGEVTTFENISATLGLFYLQNNEYVEFPSYYTFGGDTAEATTNVHVTLTPQGYAELSVGKPDLTYVVINSPSTLHIETIASGTFQTTTTQSNTTQTSVTTTTTTTTTTQPATSSTTTTSAQTSITSTTTQTATPQTSVPSQTSSNQPITYVILTGVILLVYYALSRALRRRK
jgi:thermopsin